LREWVANSIEGAAPENVQIVSGSQQAIDLAGRIFLNPGDKVALSAPTYTGGISTLKVYRPTFVEIECDDQGMIPDSVEKALQQSPKFLYCIPNFMNPTGVDMSLERRESVVALARQYEVPILEDDPYGALRFEGEAKPNLYELGPDCVLYGGTFSKIFAPGFRVGWIVAPLEAREKLTQAKQSADLQVANYNQRLLFEAIQDGFIETQIEQVRSYYYAQRNLMMEAIDEYFPKAVEYEAPAGGMFVWCRLPEHIDTTVLLERALEAEVAYVPGTPFYAHGGGRNTMRLSFSLATADEIDEGLARLGKVIQEAL